MNEADEAAQKDSNITMQKRGWSSAEVTWLHIGDVEVAEMTKIRRVTTAPYPINASFIQNMEPKKNPKTAPNAIKAIQMSQQVRDVAEVLRRIKMGSFSSNTLLTSRSVVMVIKNSVKPSMRLFVAGNWVYAVRVTPTVQMAIR